MAARDGRRAILLAPGERYLGLGEVWAFLEAAQQIAVGVHSMGASIAYRVAFEPQQVHKVFILPANEDFSLNEAGKVAGFFVHAGVTARAGHL